MLRKTERNAMQININTSIFLLILILTKVMTKCMYSRGTSRWYSAYCGSTLLFYVPIIPLWKGEDRNEEPIHE